MGLICHLACYGPRYILWFWSLRYELDVTAEKNFTKVRKAIATGFFFHAGWKDPQEGCHTLVQTHPVYIHPPEEKKFHQEELKWNTLN